MPIDRELQEIIADQIREQRIGPRYTGSNPVGNEGAGGGLPPSPPGGGGTTTPPPGSGGDAWRYNHVPGYPGFYQDPSTGQWYTMEGGQLRKSSAPTDADKDDGIYQQPVDPPFVPYDPGDGVVTHDPQNPPLINTGGTGTAEDPIRLDPDVDEVNRRILDYKQRHEGTPVGTQQGPTAPKIGITPVPVFTGPGTIPHVNMPQRPDFAPGDGVPTPPGVPGVPGNPLPVPEGQERKAFNPHGDTIGYFSHARSYGGLPRSTGPGGISGGYYGGDPYLMAAQAAALRG